MPEKRKPAEARVKDLNLAIMRIERGRSHTKASKLTIAAVAREAGVSASLIHNHYPAIAEAIRVKLGASSRELRDSARVALKEEQQKNADLRAQITVQEGQIARLASINETLLMENKSMRAAAASGSKVVALPPRRPRNS